MLHLCSTFSYVLFSYLRYKPTYGLHNTRYEELELVLMQIESTGMHGSEGLMF